MILGCLGIFTAMLMGTALVAVIIPRAQISRRSLLFFIAIAIGAGFAIGSATYFLRLRVSSWREYHPLVMDGLALLCILAAAVSGYRRRSEAQAGAPDNVQTEAVDSAVPDPVPVLAPSSSRWSALMFVVLAVVVFFSAHTAWTILVQRPHGQWDAWAIWDLHARFLYRGGADWQLGFTEPLAWSHLDYPLLLPAAVARGWEYAGGEFFPSPAVLAMVFTALIPALLLGTLGWMRQWWVGALAAILLLSSAHYVRLGVSLCADVPLSFFILSAVVCGILAISSRDRRRQLMMLAGFLAGCAAWTKNEGLLFCIVFPASIFLAAWLTRRSPDVRGMITAFVWGLAPMALIIIIFKATVAGRSDIFVNISGQTLLSRLTDPQRHKLILSNACATFFGRFSGLTATQGGARIEPLPSELLSGHYNGLALLAVLAAAVWSRIRDRNPGGVDNDQSNWQLWFICCSLFLIMAGYYVIYLMTPYNLEWHITTSMHRLVFHMWPCGILLIVLLFPGRDDSHRLQTTRVNP